MAGSGRGSRLFEAGAAARLLKATPRNILRYADVGLGDLAGAQQLGLLEAPGKEIVVVQRGRVGSRR